MNRNEQCVTLSALWREITFGRDLGPQPSTLSSEVRAVVCMKMNHTLLPAGLLGLVCIFLAIIYKEERSESVIISPLLLSDVGKMCLKICLASISLLKDSLSCICY